MGTGDTCLLLSGSAECSDFADLYAYIQEDLSISSVASFDAYIKSGVSVDRNSYGFGQSMRLTADPGFGCPNWDGTGIRYHQSALCAAFVANGFLFGVNGTSTSPCNSNSSPPLSYCKSIMAAFTTSFSNIISNSSICPSPTTTATSYLQFFAQATSYLSTASTCTLGLSVDRSQCGFLTTAEDTKYCGTSTGKSDLCCSSLLQPSLVGGGIAQISTTAAQTDANQSDSSSLSSSTSSSSNPLSLATIIGAAGTVVFLMLSTFVCIFCKKRRRSSHLEISEDNDVNIQDINPIQSGNSKMQQSTVGGSGSPMAKQFSIDQSLAGLQKMRSDKPIGTGSDYVSTSTYSSLKRPMSSGKDTHAAVYNYFANMPDELSVNLGDMVILKSQYDDGWGYGFNTRSLKEGFFPLGVLSGFGSVANGSTYTASIESLSGRQGSGGEFSRRVSSMVVPVASGLRLQQEIQPQQNFQQVQLKQSAPLPMQKIEPKSGTATKVPPVSNKVPKLRLVTHEFTPEMTDEVQLNVGDQVQLFQEFDDGWASGRNMNSGREGILPLDCLMGYAIGEISGGNIRKHGNRVSSLYKKSYAAIILNQARSGNSYI
ncbi:C-Jun-amino-terminal kinase-interacting protein 2 [Entophlyctis luteolus]|nr:C-Jun-amino-terminal kinase-interacting protein 2 [Entophlyctis luteolus]